MQWATSLDEALGRARKEKKLVLVDFYTDWCGWCKRLDSDVFAKESFLAAAAGVVGVKVNAEREPALQRKYRVTSYPRLFFLGPDGAILEQVRGYLNLNDFTEKVKAVQRGESEYAVLRRAAGDPSNITALHRFARFLGDSDRLDEAIPYWQSVHDLALRQLFGTPPNQAMGTYHRDALLELGRAYLHVGLHDVGVQHLREVIGAYSDTPQAAQAADLLRRAEAARAATPKASP
jgi:thioredoxin-related protein